MNARYEFDQARFRRARGIRRREELASVAGVSVQTIRNWESGRYEPPGSKLLRIAELTGKPYQYFFRRPRRAA